MPPKTIAQIAEEYLDSAEKSLDQGDFEGALNACTTALEMVPNHPGAHFVMGDTFRILGFLEDAAESYKTAALARPDHSSSWASLSLTMFELHKFGEAKRAGSRALRIRRF